jgi:hypothetical protein
MKNYLPKHGIAYYSTPDPAAPRNYTTEMLQTLAGDQQTAGPRLSLEQQFQPQYGQLALNNQAQNLYGFTDAQGNHHPGALELQRTSQSYQRAGNIADVTALGPASTQAYLAANPYLAANLNNLQGRTQNTDILNTLNTQANAGLAAGGKLSPQEQHAIDQQTAQAFSERGNYMGNQAIGSQLLNRDAAVRARALQAQQFAGTVQGMNQSQNDFVGRATQISGTSLSDPYQAVLNQSSGSGSSGASGASYPQTIGVGTQLFNPQNPYAQDLYNTNANAQAANNINQSNAQNAQTSGYLSLIGSLLSDKRIKTNIKKTDDETEDGVPIYEWEYKTDPKHKRYRGVMAQDQEEADPESVETDELSGLKLIKREAKTPFQEVRGKGRHKKYFNLVSGEMEEAA